MSAKAAYNKFLELEKLSKLSTTSTPNDKLNSVGIKSDDGLYQGLEVIFLIVLYIFFRFFLALVKWYGRLCYFKARRNTSSLQTLYYTFLYSSGAGDEILPKIFSTFIN